MKKPAKKAKPAKTTKRDPELAMWAAQVEARLKELCAANADNETEIGRIDEELIKDKRELDRLDTEVKRAHARISALEHRVARTAGARVTHVKYGAGRIFSVSRDVALVEWDNGRSTGIVLSQLSDEVTDQSALLGETP